MPQTLSHFAWRTIIFLDRIICPRVAFALVVAILVLALLPLSGCSVYRSQQAAEAKEELVGMSEGQVLSCMGAPQQAFQAEDIVVWSYAGGGDTRSYSGGIEWNEKTNYNVIDADTIQRDDYTVYQGNVGNSLLRSCTVNVEFRRGKVRQVTYAGRTGGLLTEGEQCAFIVGNCVQ